MTAPNAELAYAALDEIDADPRAWDQARWDACFAAVVVRLSGGRIGPTLPGFTFRWAPAVTHGPGELGRQDRGGRRPGGAAYPARPR